MCGDCAAFWSHNVELRSLLSSITMPRHVTGCRSVMQTVATKGLSNFRTSLQRKSSPAASKTAAAGSREGLIINEFEMLHQICCEHSLNPDGHKSRAFRKRSIRGTG